MDRGEDRDLLSSAFFDGSNDRLYNKRTDIQQENNRGRESDQEVGGSDFHWDAFRYTGVKFARPRQQDMSDIWILRRKLYKQ